VIGFNRSPFTVFLCAASCVLNVKIRPSRDGSFRGTTPVAPSHLAVRPDPSGAVTGSPGFLSAVWHRGNSSGVIFPVPHVSGLSPLPDRWEHGPGQVLSPS